MPYTILAMLVETLGGEKVRAWLPAAVNTIAHG
jgi:hypothetical protein